ncbi:DNA-processing protein DprA [Streptomyces sp. NPDC059740]|uniref:DNA-processing protein DprA n=1 Tax=Streptomyces sp. NPDC059740 TaxID=3346926 RepID=UPI00365E6F1A
MRDPERAATAGRNGYELPAAGWRLTAGGPVPPDERGEEARDTERLARAALTRVVEPGDETVGRVVSAIGAVRLLELLTCSGDPPPRVAELGLGASKLAGLRLRATDLTPRADLATVAAAGGRFVCPGDEEWPRQLDDLGAGRPLGLWVRGEPNLRFLALRSVAVVGSRACTEYGAHEAATLAAGLAERGWTVVSGAAYGVDGAAHRGALSVAGATVAVVASGVDRHYPSGHTELLRRIAAQGLVVAELAPGDHPTRRRFVLRNRVIAALTRGTVVVEAELRSGSLVTARRATALGRFTMGVPGPVTSALSAGVHQLLRTEGTLVTDAADIVELVGSIGDLAPVRRGPDNPRDLLDGVAARVLEALPARGRAEVEQVARRAGTPVSATHGKLLELQALGFTQRRDRGWELSESVRRSAASRRGGT